MKNTRGLLRLLLPSSLGILLFLVPLSFGGKTSIGLDFIIDLCELLLRGIELEAVATLVVISALGSGYCLLAKPDWEQRWPTLHAMFQVKFPWFLWRALSALLGVMLLVGVGPEFVLAEDTGPLLYPMIGVVLVTVLFVAYMLMPLLTEYGLLEFVGALVRRPFEFLFTLPGRAAVDATSSIVSASSVGVVLTISQYESGYYSRREAVSIATNFSIVSLPFSLVVAQTAGIAHLFFSWYLSVVAVCLVCAAVMVRIPPLVRIEETYYGPAGRQVHEELPAGVSAFAWSLEQATARAAAADSPRVILDRAWKNYWVTLFNVLGPGLLISVSAAILAFHTPVLGVLAYPIRLALEALSLPEAAAVAPGFVIGFLDQFTPAVLATRVESEQMRFVLAGLSISQLIYLADMGVMLLRSSLGLRLRDLALLFVMRTMIVAPMLVGLSYLLV